MALGYCLWYPNVGLNLDLYKIRLKEDMCTQLLETNVGSDNFLTISEIGKSTEKVCFVPISGVLISG